MVTQASLGIGITTNSTSLEVHSPEQLRDAQVTCAIEGTGTFTVDIEASIDGSFWYSIATKTADEIFSLILASNYRAVFTGMSGAFVTVTLDFSPKLRQNPL